MNAIQERIDEYLRTTVLRTVNDCIYFPLEQVVVVLRKKGHRNVSVDVSEAASPSEVLEKVISNVAVY